MTHTENTTVLNKWHLYQVALSCQIGTMLNQRHSQRNTAGALPSGHAGWLQLSSQAGVPPEDAEAAVTVIW